PSLEAPYSKPIDVPLPLAAGVAGGIAATFLLLTHFNQPDFSWTRELSLLNRNERPLMALGISGIIDIFWLGIAGEAFRKYLKRLWLVRKMPGVKRPTSPLAGLPGSKFWAGFTSALLFLSGTVAFVFIPFSQVEGKPSSETLRWINGGYGLALFLTGLGVVIGGLRLVEILPLPGRRSRKLSRYPVLKDAIVLGSLFEEKAGAKMEWASVSAKALTGNMAKFGSIGTGKSQDILRAINQVLTNFSKRPALLAIDPKRTFVRELKALATRLGLSEHIFYVSLHGSVRMNPIWKEDLLKNSAFVDVANTLKLASINFLGSGSENRIWEQLSFNLLKNALIYCAAKHEYYTFLDLYNAIVIARDEDISAKLVDLLAARDWTIEERHNIETAIRYFKDEFSRMDEKVRTSVLVTATGFLSEFQEYRVSRIFSPRKEEITFPSMKEAIEG
ncbi:MAG: hypothetical protein AAB425_01935, partial [Bdellovibrionota bacterium]